MEFVIAAVIIIVLLLILGVSPGIIMGGVLVLIELGLVLMTGFFIFSLVLLLIARPIKAEFLRIYVSDIVGTFAVYRIDGEEYHNTFPAEIMFVDKIYHEGKTYDARFRKIGKKHILLDWYSYIVIGVGLPVSAALAAGLGWFLLQFVGL